MEASVIERFGLVPSSTTLKVPNGGKCDRKCSVIPLRVSWGEIRIAGVSSHSRCSHGFTAKACAPFVLPGLPCQAHSACGCTGFSCESLFVGLRCGLAHRGGGVLVDR